LRNVFGDTGNLDPWVKDIKPHAPDMKVVVLDSSPTYAA
jgi:hypothetical protein